MLVRFVRYFCRSALRLEYFLGGTVIGGMVWVSQAMLEATDRLYLTFSIFAWIAIVCFVFRFIDHKEAKRSDREPLLARDYLRLRNAGVRSVLLLLAVSTVAAFDVGVMLDWSFRKEQLTLEVAAVTDRLPTAPVVGREKRVLVFVDNSQSMSTFYDRVAGFMPERAASEFVQDQLSRQLEAWIRRLTPDDSLYLYSFADAPISPANELVAVAGGLRPHLQTYLEDALDQLDLTDTRTALRVPLQYVDLRAQAAGSDSFIVAILTDGVSDPQNTSQMHPLVAAQSRPPGVAAGHPAIRDLEVTKGLYDRLRAGGRVAVHFYSPFLNDLQPLLQPETAAFTPLFGSKPLDSLVSLVSLGPVPDVILEAPAQVAVGERKWLLAVGLLIVVFAVVVWLSRRLAGNRWTALFVERYYGHLVVCWPQRSMLPLDIRDGQFNVEEGFAWIRLKLGSPGTSVRLEEGVLRPMPQDDWESTCTVVNDGAPLRLDLRKLGIRKWCSLVYKHVHSEHREKLEFYRSDEEVIQIWLPIGSGKGGVLAFDEKQLQDRIAFADRARPWVPVPTS